MPWVPHAESPPARASNAVASASIFTDSLMRAGIYRSEPVSGSGGSQSQEYHHQSRQRHNAHLAPYDRRDDRVLLSSGKLPDGPRVGKLALVEDRLRRADTQLLGDEPDRQR